ncbi:MAG: ABC transporter permease [Lachnospiraceae bacterium]|nr:ABC transporter permease [Lachnospiraceae bacterium]
MRFKNHLFFIRKRIHTGLKISILGMIISILGFSLLIVEISIPRVITRAYRDLDSLLPFGLDGAAYIYAASELKGDTAEWDGFSECIKELCSVEGIMSAGVVSRCFLDLNLEYEGVSYRDRMLEIRHSGMNNYMSKEDVSAFPEEVNSMYRDMIESNLECVKMDKYSAGFSDFRLYKGEDNLENYFDRGECVLYLGYNYRDIPIGAGMNVQTVRGDTVYFRVAGILEKGSEMIDPDTINQYAIDTCYSINLDNMVILIDKDCRVSTPGWLILYDDSISFERLSTVCKDIGKRNSVILKLSSLKGKVEEQLSDFDILLAIIDLVYPIAFFVSLMMILTVQLLTAIIRNDEIGVWLSNGMIRFDIFKILLLENLMKMVPAVLAGGVLSGLYLNNKAGLKSGQQYTMFFDMYIYGPICTMIIAIILALLMTTVSYNYIRRRSLPDIIKNTWE